MAEQTLALNVVIDGFSKFSLGMQAMDAAINVVGKAWDALSGPAVAAVQSAISVESAFAGVTKTTDGLIDEFGNLNEAGEQMKDDFRELAKEVPKSFEELAEIGELGGQLGIQQENLIDFTETIAQLGETTNLANEEAASSFAQIANVMGTAQTEFSNMGSTVVALGNNMATTEKDVVNFAQRIMGAGAVVGLAESDLFGIAGAFTSLGVNVEAGGTAVQKVLLSMNEAVISGSDDLEIFAAVAGQSAEEFGEAWQEDAAGQFTKFVQGLGVAGDDALGVLKELGLEDQRLISAFLSAASASDVLANGIDLANDAWDENTALQKEAAQRFGTTESQIQLMKNRFRDFGISIGDTFLPIIGEVLDMMTQLFEVVGPEIERSLERIEPLFAILTERLQAVFDVLMEVVQGGLSWRDFVHSEFEPAVENIIVAFRSFIGILGILAEDIGAFIAGALARFGEWFDENDELILEFIAAIVTGFKSAAQGIKKFWQLVKPVLEALGELLLDVFTLIMQIVVGDWEGAWETIQQIVADAWIAIQELFVFFTEWVASWFNSDVAEIRAMWRDNWEQFKTILGLAWDAMITAISSKLGEIKQKVIDGIKAIGTWLEENFPMFTAWGKQMIEKIAQGISDNASKLKEKFAEAMEKLKDAIDNAKDFLKGIGGKIIELVSKGLGDASGSLSGALNSLLQTLTPSEETMSFLRSIGGMIVKAFRAGIEAGWDAFTAWLDNILGNIVPDILCSVFGICPGGGVQRSSVQSAVNGTTSPIVSLGGASSMSSNSTTNNFNLTSQSIMRPGGLEMEFEAMSMATR